MNKVELLTAYSMTAWCCGVVDTLGASLDRGDVKSRLLECSSRLTTVGNMLHNELAAVDGGAQMDASDAPTCGL